MLSFQILEFLRGRGVQESVIEEFEKQKVNIHVSHLWCVPVS